MSGDRRDPPLLGVIVNPIAGMGGSVGLKGTDGAVEEAVARGAVPRAQDRAVRCLSVLARASSQIDVLSAGGAMGADAVRETGLEPVDEIDVYSLSTSEDTGRVAQQMVNAGVDLLLFVGGDGTATDVFRAVGTRVPVIGIPAGVKMQSAVFAQSPEAGGLAAVRFLTSGRRHWTLRDVLDLDERCLRESRLVPRLIGQMLVPAAPALLQNPKARSPLRAHSLARLGAAIADQVNPDRVVAVGPGSTAGSLLDHWKLPHTLLGFDLVRDRRLLVADAGASELARYASEMELVVAPIGGQGFVFGRGNQQLTSKVLGSLDPDRLQIVAEPERLEELLGQPLLIDIDDASVAASFTGYRRILTGPDTWRVFPVRTTVPTEGVLT